MKALHFFLVHFVWVVVWFVPLYAFFYLIYYLATLPLRRQERARFFLDLIETGLQRGHSIEKTIVSISRSRDQSVGVKFHLLAAYLESGWRFLPALEKVPSLLSPPLAAMLKVGEEIGDLRKVLPACRALLKDGASQTRGFYNYLIVLAFVFIPITPVLYWMMTRFVVPRLQQIFADALDGEAVPFLPLFYGAGTLAQVQIGLALLFYAGAIFYIGGPRMLAWLQAGFSAPSCDWVLYRVPWRRKRMQRDFSAMLAVLLDAEVPEERAVLLAAESTANQAFLRRAQSVVAGLRQGLPLMEAVQKLDDSGEFRWRLANASRSGKGFLAALSGWLEALDAKAFQQEQATAQLLTTSLVVFNGVMVALFAIFVFQGLTMIVEAGVLW
jgi:type II secretory pathway component PulF